MRFVAKFIETEKLWFLFDTKTETYGVLGYKKEKDAQDRADKCNKALSKKKGK
jgi:hypothetical protein